MDGVLAAEVLGEGCVALIVCSFFDQLGQCKSRDNFVRPGEAHPILTSVYALAYLKECGFLGYLDNLWDTLCVHGKVSKSKTPLILSNEDFGYLRQLYNIRNKMSRPSAYICMKWIIQSSEYGHYFCENLPPLKVGIENFRKVQTLSCTVGILTSLPGNPQNAKALQRAIGANDAKREQIVSKMNTNNKKGKEAFAKRVLGSDTVIVVVLPSQTKKKALSDTYGQTFAEDSKLIDDYDKNVLEFGTNGFFIPSAGHVRLQDHLKKK
eukprot:TRINITY_DN9359_c0_g1_i3.p1 TRINITY_DN9359_c0_g1~~TRINITY_DN9359_c0_g1_i3.p1  ORF type:complete len:302 (-),score=67.18 TRINITY_DN9359_c0_g1_i3:2-799(-)